MMMVVYLVGVSVSTILKIEVEIVSKSVFLTILVNRMMIYFQPCNDW